MSPEAIHGQGGFYVPCEEEPAELPPLPAGAIVGQAAGFVARDQVAAGLPTTPYGAIRGSQVGFVPAPCGTRFRLTTVWEVSHLTGVPAPDPLGERQRQTMPINAGIGGLGVFSRWDQANDPPLEFDELRYFIRFAPVPGPPPPNAIRYRIKGVVRPSGSIPGMEFKWEVRSWDWEADAPAGPMWNEGVLVESGTYVMPDDTVWSPSNPIGTLIEFEFLAAHPQRCWIGFRNTSLTGEWLEPDLSFSERSRATGGYSLLASNGLFSGYIDSWTCISIPS